MSKVKDLGPVVFIVLIAVAGMSAYALAGVLAGPRSASSAGANLGNTASGIEGVNASFSPVCGTLVKTQPSQGYVINTFLSSTSVELGNQVCVNVILENIDGRNLTVSSGGGLTIAYNITEKDGAVVFHRSCTEATLPPSSANTSVTEGPIASWSCGGFWDTGAAYDGIVPGPGSYNVVASVQVPNVVGGGLSVAYSTAAMSLTK
jgi:hypothetical protein